MNKAFTSTRVQVWYEAIVARRHAKASKAVAPRRCPIEYIPCPFWKPANERPFPVGLEKGAQLTEY